MNAEQLYKALVGSGKPLTPFRLAKAERRADSQATWLDVKQRLITEGKITQ